MFVLDGVGVKASAVNNNTNNTPLRPRYKVYFTALSEM